MNNPFDSLKPVSTVDQTSDLVVRKLSDEELKHKRDTMYAKFTPMINDILDQLIAAYRPGVWKKGSDCDHDYCCHCRWFAGPEETGRAHYGDHSIRRRIEIELEVDHQCEPTGFQVLYLDNHAKCVHVGLSQDELARGIHEVFTID